MASYRLLNFCITLFCLIGVALSIYTYVIELNIEQNSNYKAMCDINEHVSCTKVFKSEYAKGFGLVAKYFGKDSVLNQPNCIPGIIFYSLLATLSNSNSPIITKICMVLIFFSNLVSVYLGYILYFILHDLCIVCLSTYAVNFFTFLLTYYKHKCLSKTDKKPTTVGGSGKKKKSKKN